MAKKKTFVRWDNPYFDAGLNHEFFVEFMLEKKWVLIIIIIIIIIIKKILKRMLPLFFVVLCSGYYPTGNVHHLPFCINAPLQKTGEHSQDFISRSLHGRNLTDPKPK